MKKILSLLVVLIMGVAAFAADYQVYKLDNGQNVIIQPVKNNPIVTIDTWIKTGSINETDKNNGVSHFLEHLFFKGTTNHAPGEFDKILETKGAITNAATSKDFTHYYITIPSEYFNLALEMHADMLSNPLIPGKELERERKVVIEEIAKVKGPVYVRLARLATPGIYEENQTFEIGKAVQIGEGTDATVFATGVVVPEAIKAKELLEEEGIYIRVVDMHTIKPIDKEMIIKSAKETKKLISIEDHSVIGGLGSAISEVLTEEYPCKLVRRGIKDTFGKSGNAVELLKYFGLTSEGIIQMIKNN